jgi:hypothetical protein
MSPAVEQRVNPSRELSPGTIVDKQFEILEVAGRGGSGIVYKAQPVNGASGGDQITGARSGGRRLSTRLFRSMVQARNEKKRPGAPRRASSGLV